MSDAMGSELVMKFILEFIGKFFDSWMGHRSAITTCHSDLEACRRRNKLQLTYVVGFVAVCLIALFIFCQNYTVIPKALPA